MGRANRERRRTSQGVKHTYNYRFIMFESTHTKDWVPTIQKNTGKEIVTATETETETESERMKTMGGKKMTICVKHCVCRGMLLAASFSQFSLLFSGFPAVFQLQKCVH